MKKALAFVLAMTLGVSMLTACGSSASSTTDASADTAEDKTEDTAEAPAASGEGSVYYLNFKPEQDAQWQELADRRCSAGICL